MGKKLRFGIIGCGNIANVKHLPALSKRPEAELVAFCDIVPERAERFAARYGAANAKVFSDYRALLEEGAVDVVHVLTPNRSHCEITVAAFEAGKHVFCEKPMAATEPDAKEMMDAWKKSGKHFTIGYQWRYRPQTLYLKQLCESGELGDIYYAKAASVRRRGVPTWGRYINEKAQGGGPLIDSGSHGLDLALWLMNNYKPVSVTGSVYKKLYDGTDGSAYGPWEPSDFQVEDSACGLIKMADGATLMLEAAWLLNMLPPVQPHSVVLCGTKAGADMSEPGGLRINTIYRGKMVVTNSGDLTRLDPSVYASNPREPMDYEAEHWINCLLNDARPAALPEEAYVVAKIIDALYRSAKSGETIYF